MFPFLVVAWFGINMQLHFCLHTKPYVFRGCFMLDHAPNGSIEYKCTREVE